MAAERKRTELETALLNLATDKDEEDGEDQELVLRATMEFVQQLK